MIQLVIFSNTLDHNFLQRISQLHFIFLQLQVTTSGILKMKMKLHDEILLAKATKKIEIRCQK